MRHRIAGAMVVILLVGYAFLGKGFAYIHVPTPIPLFVGEIGILVAALALMRFGAILQLLRTPIVWLWGMLALVGLIGTLGNIEYYGAAALRDAAVYYYGVFMLFAILLLSARRKLERLAAGFARVAPYYLVWAAAACLLSVFLRDRLPTLPGTDMPILWLKPADVAVHVGAILIFILVMPASFGIVRRNAVAFVLCLTGIAPTLFSRAALLAVALAVACAGVFKASRRFVKFGFLVLALLVALLLVNPQTDLPGRNRSLSVAGVVDGIQALLDFEGYGENRSTIRWRYEWWRDIVEDTFGGRYFWTGLGFGENLAVRYGIISDDENVYALRSPHNVFMTFLVRMGIPGLAIWVTLNGIWLAMVWRMRRQARREEDHFLDGLSVWLLAYWTMSIVVASTDVYLEGPQGGIWFWTVLGIGIAARRTQSDESAPGRTACLPRT